MNTTTDIAPVYIRKATYRGKEGFTIKSRRGGIFGTSIFTITRESAEVIKSRVIAGEEVTLADFAL